jgi:hypothetical protein
MGHRTLLAYERDDDYELYETQWGGDGFALAGTLRSGPGPGPPVPSRQCGVAASIREVATDHVDYLHHEAVYVVDADEVRCYRPLWFGLADDCERVETSRTVGNGVLMGRGTDEDGYVRGWFRGVKSTVADGVDRGVCTVPAAVAYLRSRVGAFAGPRSVVDGRPTG